MQKNGSFETLHDKPPSLSDWAVDRIREAIVTGDVKPGDRLVEMHLAQLLGISRAPLREALKVLERDGLVETRKNRGAYVVNPSREKLQNMVLARAIAEGAAGRLCVARKTGDSIERLKATLLAQHEARNAGRMGDVAHLHWEIHRMICMESGNSYLLDMWSRVCTVLRVYSSDTIYHVAPGNNSVFISYIETKDGSEVDALLRSQIIAMSYISMREEPPAHIAPYITRFIDAENKVHRVDTLDMEHLRRLAGLDAAKTSLGGSALAD
jgi:DNA-binding GntR family transcriptional regulator